MNISAKKSGIILSCLLILLFILFGVLASTSVRADVGVQPILPGGSNIQSNEETPIIMAAETVEMTVREATQSDNDLIQLNPEPYGLYSGNVWFTAIAEVKADFTMHNPTGEVINMTVWFPLASALESVSWEINPDEIVPRIESFKVSADGYPVDYAVSELPNLKGADKPPLPWASFLMTFAAEKETHIEVSYLVPLVPSIKGKPLALYYVFQTGASWAGPIGRAELTVTLPYPASAETIADLPGDRLDLPYMMAGASTGLPAGVILEGNQARWEWKDFEPGPEDDFSIWLVDPVDWEELSAARAVLEADAENGARWLKLADLYRNLATVAYNAASAFSNAYLPLGIEAYQKAAALMPDHPAPHAGLALLWLSGYMRNPNAPQEVMDSIQKEFEACKELASKLPYAASSQDYCWPLEDALSIYTFNASATMELIAGGTELAQKTLDASIVLAPTSTPWAETAPTTTSAPTNTALPQPSATPVPQWTASGGLNLLVLMAGGIVAIIVLGYLISKRRKLD